MSSKTPRTENIPLIRTLPYTSFFRDGKRKIDAVLVYSSDTKNVQREEFIANLKTKNLETEQEIAAYEESLVYLKVHAPKEVLIRYSKKYEITPKFREITRLPEPKVYFNCMKTILNDPTPDVNDPLVKRAWETICKAKEDDFTTCERSSIVFSIMSYVKYGSDPFNVGLPQLLHQGVFLAAYPLHDGEWHWPDNDTVGLNDRQLLAKYWANFPAWNKQQPLNTIEKYFGCEIAMYFGWLGFYNKMLLIASALGILTFLYGLFNMFFMFSVSVHEACESDIDICPKCETCRPEKLNNYCTAFRYALVNDNFGSVIYACVMSFWATIFMELWKREEATLSLRWKISSDIDYVHLRPEFRAAANNIRVHKYTEEPEQYIPIWKKIKSFTISIAMVVFMVLVVLATIFSIILYECTLKMYEVHGIYITMTAAMLTLAVMLIFRQIYGAIAIWLTNQEIPRTQLEYDKSYMIKMVIFSLVNNYGKLIYIAFFKGKFFTYPGDKNVRTSKFPMAAEICDPTGCVSELFTLLATITVAKPILTNFIEVMTPKMRVWMNKLRKRFKYHHVSLPSWEQDYDLNPSDHFSIMEEFEEMVVQYGFVTLLVAAFPLAPLTALINNIFEVRIDSTKILKYYRRPEARQIASFNVWFDTLQAITYMAVITNALFITFTSNFIPQLVYQNQIEADMKGYVNFTLSEYSIADSYWVNTNIKTCYYVGYRYPPGHKEQYEHSYMYFYILSCRLGFAIIFAVIVLGLTGILAYAIPDVPQSIKDQIAYNTKKAREMTSS